MTKLEITIQKLYDKGINIDYQSLSFLDTKSLSFILDTYKSIVVDKEAIANSKDFNTILLHEEIHHDYPSTMYSLSANLRKIKYNETRAGKKLIREVLPFEKLASLIKKYGNAFEIAEETCLNVDLINDAFTFYKDQGLFEEAREEY